MEASARFSKAPNATSSVRYPREQSPALHRHCLLQLASVSMVRLSSSEPTTSATCGPPQSNKSGEAVRPRDKEAPDSKAHGEFQEILRYLLTAHSSYLRVSEGCLRAP